MVRAERPHRFIATLTLAVALVGGVSGPRTAPRFHGSSPTQSSSAVSAGQSDEMGLPGCLLVLGRPRSARCEPCPPIWLGGAGIACVAPIWPLLAEPRGISLYPGGPPLARQDLIALGRPVIPAKIR